MLADRSSSGTCSEVNVFFLRCFTAVLTSELEADVRSGSPHHRGAELTSQHYLHSTDLLWSLFEIPLVQLVPGGGDELGSRLLRCST